MTHLISYHSPNGFTLKRCDRLRTLILNEELAIFTMTEYRLLLVLLEKEIVADSTLIEAMFQTSTVDSSVLKNLNKHIENAKSKLRCTGLSIRRVHRYGYALVIDRKETKIEKR
jgi:DNA-binding winged helix-turn-helix (wHTH) protein